MTLQAPSTPPSPCPPPPSSDQISTHHGTFQREVSRSCTADAVVGAEVARLVGGDGSVEQWDAARRSTRGGVSRGASRASRRDGRGRGSIVRLAARITARRTPSVTPDSAWSGPQFRSVKRQVKSGNGDARFFDPRGALSPWGASGRYGRRGWRWRRALPGGGDGAPASLHPTRAQRARRTGEEATRAGEVCGQEGKTGNEKKAERKEAAYPLQP